MKILVPVKRVIDYNVKPRVKADGSGVDLANVKMSMNPFDEIAVEEAIRIKEAGKAEEIIAVSVGPPKAQETLRTALAMGADAAVRLDLPGDADSATNARALAAAIGKLDQAGVVFVGKEAIDDGAGAVGTMLAVKLGLPCVNVVNGIEYGDGSVTCRRDVGGGNIEIIETPLPAVISAQVGLNEPRYATALNIIKAKKKPIDTMTADELGVTDADRKTRLRNFELPPPKQPCRIIEGSPAEQANELIRVLAEDVQAI